MTTLAFCYLTIGLMLLIFLRSHGPPNRWWKTPVLVLAWPIVLWIVWKDR